MKIKLFAFVLVLMLFIFSTVAVSANVYADDTVIPPVAEIEEILKGLLPVFEDFYGYNLITDLNHAGLNLTDFSWQLRNYLNFLYEADVLDQLGFDTHDDYWIIYFLDGIVMEMSESAASAWGNVSLKGLVLNNIYVNALGPDFLNGFFSHRSIAYLAQNLEIAAYFDFLMRDESIAAVLPFGAAAKAYFEHGDTAGLIALIGRENVAALGPMYVGMRVNFLAGLLMDRMAPVLDDIIAEYENFIVIPSPNLVVPVKISRETIERTRNLTFIDDTAFVVTSGIDNDEFDIYFSNTGHDDFFVVLQAYDDEGCWHIFMSALVPAGELHANLFPVDADLGDFFRITVYSPSLGLDGKKISGEFVMKIQ